MIPDFVCRVDIIDKNFVQKSFFESHNPKKIFCYFFDPQILKKKFFFDLKIECLMWVVGPKNAFQSTFLDVLSDPYTICLYLKKNFCLEKYGILTPSDPQNTKIFGSQIFFLRYGHVV